MIEVVVVGEGQTEETFVRDILAPEFGLHGISVRARLVRTSAQGRGGSLNYARVKRFLENTLKERADVYVTTFFDLYRLHREFPGFEDASKAGDVQTRVQRLESQLQAEIVASVGCRGERFFPHVQPYEYEALLFSDVECLVAIEPGWEAQVDKLKAVRREFRSPEDINDGSATHPSARLDAMMQPRYRKVLHGSRGAQKIGLQKLTSECAHFGRWIERILALKG